MFCWIPWHLLFIFIFASHWFYDVQDQEVDVNWRNPYLLTVWLNLFFFYLENLCWENWGKYWMMFQLASLLIQIIQNQLYKWFVIDFIETRVMAFIQCVRGHENSNNKLTENKFWTMTVWPNSNMHVFYQLNIRIYWK